MVGGVFEAGLPAAQRRLGEIGSGAGFQDNGLYRHREAGSRSAGERGFARRAFAAVARLILPVAVLLVTFIAAYLYNDTKLASLGIPADGLTLGYLLLPTIFFASHLTNRRYGPGYAFAQIVITWIAVAGAFVAAQNYLGANAIPNPFPDSRALGAFLAGLFLAQIASVIVFDASRGPRWWSAPLFASFWAGVAFCAVYYPAAYAGRNGIWATDMVLEFGLMAAMAIALIIPYWLLRPIIRPLPGFGGY